MSTAELKKDMDAVNTLTQYLRRVEELRDLIDDTVMLAGSEAYVAALAFYNAIKLGARRILPAPSRSMKILKNALPNRGTPRRPSLRRRNIPGSPKRRSVFVVHMPLCSAFLLRTAPSVKVE